MSQAADQQTEFCLAQINPNGNDPTGTKRKSFYVTNGTLRKTE
ncbi:MAG: hypothetical protein QMB11_13095 [Nonlabens sp.]